MVQGVSARVFIGTPSSRMSTGMGNWQNFQGSNVKSSASVPEFRKGHLCHARKKLSPRLRDEWLGWAHDESHVIYRPSVVRGREREDLRL